VSAAIGTAGAAGADGGAEQVELDGGVEAEAERYAGRIAVPLPGDRVDEAPESG